VTAALGLTPGLALPPRTHHVDQPLIAFYAEISGDHNPLHTDPTFAAGTRFGRTIAHGMMTLAFLSAALEAWAGPAWSNGGTIDVTFLSPVYPGEDVVVGGTVVASEEPDKVACSVECKAAGRRIVAGTARWPLAVPGVASR
jgi:3-hydroxybutyryl-CoA dehydratase